MYPARTDGWKSNWRRVNGVYYTPDDVALALATWAIRSDDDRVFDPCYGGCAFLEAAYEVLLRHGAPNPASNLWGVDSDPQAQSHAQGLISRGASADQFVHADFLTIDEASFPAAPFSVVLANPPYVRHHYLKSSTIRVGHKAAEYVGIDLSARASYWAYFVAHLLRFVAPDGRIALVLPGALLTADYARQLRRALVQRFRRLSILLVEDRLFPAAQETTVLVLAEGHGAEQCAVRMGIISRKSISELTEEKLERVCRPLPQQWQDDRWIKGVIETDAIEYLEHLVQKSHAVTLGKVASIGIGTVTGANRYFILRPSQLRHLGIPQTCVKPILTRASQLPGLVLRECDVERLLESDAQMLLVTTGGEDVPPELAAYFAEGEKIGIPHRYKCRSRRPWYVVPNTSPPDAFLPSLMGYAPRLVVNQAKIECTNTILRVNLREAEEPATILLLALASVSTVTQLSAELVGRSYGGGVLKLEPSEAAQLVIPRLSLADVSHLIGGIHNLNSIGRIQQITHEVDRVISRAIGISRDEQLAVSESLQRLRRWRTGKTSD